MANVIPFPPQPRPAATFPGGRPGGAPRPTPVDFLRVPLLPVLRSFEAAPVVPRRSSRSSRPVALRF